MTYVEIISIANIVIQGLFWGTLVCAASKRLVKFTLIFAIPYLSFAADYPFIFNSFKYMGDSASSLVDYIGGIIIPFAILGMLRIAKTLMTNLKSKILLGIVFTITTIMLFPYI